MITQENNFTTYWNTQTQKYTKGIKNDLKSLILENLTVIGELTNTSGKLSFMNDGKIVHCRDGWMRSARGFVPSSMKWATGTHTYSDNLNHIDSFRKYLETFSRTEILGKLIAEHFIKTMKNCQFGLKILSNNYKNSKKQDKSIICDQFHSKINECIEKIQENIKSYLVAKKDLEPITRELSKIGLTSSLVYQIELPEFPNLNFKLFLAKNHEWSRVYKNAKLAQRICRLHKLDLLTIPKMQQFKLDYKNQQLTLLVQENCGANIDPSYQEELYLSKKDLSETLLQITQFICLTGFCNVDWSTIPLLEKQNLDGYEKVALLNLIEMDDPVAGLCGKEAPHFRGLLRCIDPKYSSRLIEEASLILGLHQLKTSRFVVSALRLRAREIQILKNSVEEPIYLAREL